MVVPSFEHVYSSIDRRKVYVLKSKQCQTVDVRCTLTDCLEENWQSLGQCHKCQTADVQRTLADCLLENWQSVGQCWRTTYPRQLPGGKLANRVRLPTYNAPLPTETGKVSASVRLPTYNVPSPTRKTGALALVSCVPNAGVMQCNTVSRTYLYTVTRAKRGNGAKSKRINGKQHLPVSVFLLLHSNAVQRLNSEHFWKRFFSLLL